MFNVELTPRLLSTTSAARYLGVSAMFIRRLVYRGDLKPTLRLRKMMRFDVRDLDVWIERQKIASL